MFAQEFEKVAGFKSAVKPLVRETKKAGVKAGGAIKAHFAQHGYAPILAAGTLGTAVGANRTANKGKK